MPIIINLTAAYAGWEEVWYNFVSLRCTITHFISINKKAALKGAAFYSIQIN
jgi:hypothetical protein